MNHDPWNHCRNACFPGTNPVTFLFKEWFKPFIFILRTNIPKEIMTFCDFPFASVDFPLGQDPADSFPRHEVVLAYLQRFAKPVRHLIRVSHGAHPPPPITWTLNL